MRVNYDKNFFDGKLYPTSADCEDAVEEVIYSDVGKPISPTTADAVFRALDNGLMRDTDWTGTQEKYGWKDDVHIDVFKNSAAESLRRLLPVKYKLTVDDKDIFVGLDIALNNDTSVYVTYEDGKIVNMTTEHPFPDHLG